MASLCHPWFTTTNLFYRFPIFETSATALCGTTAIFTDTYCVYIYIHTYSRNVNINIRAKEIPMYIHTYTTLHYITLYYIILHYITLYCIILHYIASYYIILHHITLYYIILHHCIILHYITLHTYIYMYTLCMCCTHACLYTFVIWWFMWKTHEVLLVYPAQKQLI